MPQCNGNPAKEVFGAAGTGAVYTCIVVCNSLCASVEWGVVLHLMRGAIATHLHK